MPTLRRRTGIDRKSSPSKRTMPASGRSSPASTRNSVVLPDPEGPSNARNSLSLACNDTAFSAGNRPKDLETPLISSDSRDSPRSPAPLAASMSSVGCEFTGMTPFETCLEDQGDESEGGQERGRREGADEVIVIVKHLDVKRERGGQAADVAGNDGDGAELAHRAGVAQQDPVEQRPADVRHGDLPEGGEPAGAQGQRRGLLVRALVLHQRNQLARHEREGHQDGRQDETGGGEDDLDVVVDQPGPEPALRA